MFNTDVEDIKSSSKGVFVAERKIPDTYHIKRKKTLENMAMKTQINMLENDVSEIKEMLKKLLEKDS